MIKIGRPNQRICSCAVFIIVIQSHWHFWKIPTVICSRYIFVLYYLWNGSSNTLLSVRSGFGYSKHPRSSNLKEAKSITVQTPVLFQWAITSFLHLHRDETIFDLMTEILNWEVHCITLRSGTMLRGFEIPGNLKTPEHGQGFWNTRKFKSPEFELTSTPCKLYHRYRPDFPRAELAFKASIRKS